MSISLYVQATCAPEETVKSSTDIEYYVKWKERSYMHCSWVAHSALLAAMKEYVGLKTRLQRYERSIKMPHQASSRPASTSEPYSGDLQIQLGHTIWQDICTAVQAALSAVILLDLTATSAVPSAAALKEGTSAYQLAMVSAMANLRFWT